MIFTRKRLPLNARQWWGSSLKCLLEYQGFTAVPLLTLALCLHFCSKIEGNSYILAFLDQTPRFLASKLSLKTTKLNSNYHADYGDACILTQTNYRVGN